MRDICWGAFDELLTPAYWKGQAWQHSSLETYGDFRLGRTFIEEVAACLLGGHGIPAEIGLAAFRRLRDSGLLAAGHSAARIERALLQPFFYDGRSRRYRFARQKATYLAASLRALDGVELPNNDVELRNLLMTLKGIGPKTASWIVRNYRGSDSVAIIDVHVLRAGRHIGLFDENLRPDQDYFRLENDFLAFAAAIDVRPALLDALIWDYMRRLGTGAVLANPSRLSHAQNSHRQHGPLAPLQHRQHVGATPVH
jgi:thermostable 8-oxoguanine DNA glycosylase